MVLDQLDTRVAINGLQTVSFDVLSMNEDKINKKDIRDISQEFRLCGLRWRLEVHATRNGGLGVFLYSSHVRLNSDAVKLTSLPAAVHQSFGQRDGEAKYEHVIVKQLAITVLDQLTQKAWKWGGGEDEVFLAASNVKALAFTSAEYGGMGL